MHYAKPAITLVDAAKSAIQGAPKSSGMTDHTPYQHILTTNAYEADE